MGTHETTSTEPPSRCEHAIKLLDFIGETAAYYFKVSRYVLPPKFQNPYLLTQSQQLLEKSRGLINEHIRYLGGLPVEIDGDTPGAKVQQTLTQLRAFDFPNGNLEWSAQGFSPG